MSKPFKVIDPRTLSHSNITATTFDWSECFICQQRTPENLQCPASCKRSDVEEGAGYITFETIVERCKIINWFPVKLNLDTILDNDGLANCMRRNNAKWHKTCRNMFSDYKIDRHLKQKRKGDSVEHETETKRTRLSAGNATATMTKDCFFCGDASGDLHKASTFGMDMKVRKCALDLQDTVILAKLSAGDMIAQEAVYHRNCLRAFYNKARPHKEKSNDDKSILDGIVLAEIVAYIDESRTDSDVTPIFKLADITKMYNSRLQQLGVISEVHSTDLKNRILAAIPDLHAQKQGRHVYLVFKDDIGEALMQALDRNYDDDAMVLSKAAKIVRKDLLGCKYMFQGNFNNESQQSSVPQSLKTLVGMILGGPNIQMQSSNSVEAQATLTISQLLQFNSCIRRRKDSQFTISHSLDRESPLPLYIGLLLHAETRKRGLIDKLYSLGISVSYDRVMQISTALGNSICESFNNENVVCPSKLRTGVFTTAAVDNIDHNPSSTSAQGSLHGTAISMFQHPYLGKEGVERLSPPIDVNSSKRVSLQPLPEAYTVVPPVVQPKEQPDIPPVYGPMPDNGDVTLSALDLEYSWLDHVRDRIDEEDLDDMEFTWASFHANKIEKDTNGPLDISCLLPMFQEEAKSMAMIRHSMTIIKENTHYLNPDQIPVMTCDQPLYALAKLIQWNWPDAFSENQFVVVFGGLHIEIAAYRTIGDWLENSGWTSALCRADIASSGIADSFLKASHVSRTRHAHEVTACALYILMKRLYDKFLEEHGEEDIPLSFEEWREQCEMESPLFHYWSITLRFELLILLFVRSLREGNFSLYKDAIAGLIPWFFALDHPNYARWVPIHYRDMTALTSNAQSVAQEFENGKFVLTKTHSKFSSIALDQGHEQNNKLVKGDGGAIGLTENMTQLQRWMVSGPEMARLINEFQSAQEEIKRDQSKGPDIRHHEQVKSRQSNFSKQVKSLCDVLEEMGNPFEEQSDDLLILDTRDIVDPRVTDTIRKVEDLGKEQYRQYVKERLEDKSTSLNTPIKQNKLPLFSRQHPKNETKEKQQIMSLKQNCSLFSQLYVSCQVRNGDIDQFFRHENQSYPPALSQFGEMRHGTKSDLLVPLEKLDKSPRDECPDVDMLILDGAAIINMLKPRASRTFEDYFRDIFMPYIYGKLQSVGRIDIVWDEYRPDSLKSATREKRGKGIRRRVLADSQIPGNWQAFLKVDDNKKELFAFISEQVEAVKPEIDTPKQVLVTQNEDVLSWKPKDMSRLVPCAHEEADTRMLLHANDGCQDGLRRILIRTVDTDVVVIAVAMFHQLAAEGMWVAFGVGKNFHYIAIHEIARSLGPEKSHGILVFHALSGCDQVSSFSNKGKKSAWETWLQFPDVTNTFILLSEAPSPDVVIENMGMIERFVILMYDKTSECENVDDARKDLFTRKGRAIDHIPPTAAALLQHTKRATYQGMCWWKSLQTSPNLDSPGEWGWKRDKHDMWKPFWTTLKQASECCNELIKCGCKVENGCRGRCKCVKAMLQCTALCNCGGECDRN